MQNLPKPHSIGPNSTRWPLSELLRLEAERDGKEPPILKPEQERYLSARQVAQRYGVSLNTVWRWARGEVAA